MRPPSSLVAASLLALPLACGPRVTPATPPKAAPTSLGTPVRPGASATPATPRPPAEPEAPWDPAATCRADGYDFVYTVEDNGTSLAVTCGVGPGTPCQGEANRCDGANLLSCMYGKESLTDCRRFCREHGNGMGSVYDGGGCITERSNSSCVCCDAGEPGCQHETPRPPSPTPEGGVRLAKP